MVILHPKKLVVYTLQAVGNQQNQASYYQLHKNYEHKLERTCANMVIGPFGNHNSASRVKLTFACAFSISIKMLFAYRVPVRMFPVLTQALFSKTIFGRVCDGSLCRFRQLTSLCTGLVNSMPSVGSCYRIHWRACLS